MGPTRGSRGSVTGGACLRDQGPVCRDRGGMQSRALIRRCRSTTTMPPMRSRRTKTVDDDIARYLREREQAWEAPRLTTLVETGGRVGHTKEDGSFEAMERRPGRPAAFMNCNPKIFQSWEAACFVFEEMTTFKAAHGVSRAPNGLRAELWKIAQHRYPAAVESAVFDYIRMYKKRL
jgi:hypothetical protein